MAMIVHSSTNANEYNLVLYETHPTMGQYHQCIVGQFTLPNDVVVGSNKVVFVDLRLHPDGQHIIITTRNQNIFLIRYVVKHNNDTTLMHDQNPNPNDLKYHLSIITQFTMKNNNNNIDPNDSEMATSDSNNDGYSAATLHPDGLIYIAAMSLTGDITLWDLKSQQMAGTLTYPSEPTTTTSETSQHRDVSSMQFSNNGYHLAVAYKQSGFIHIWDLRKQSILVTLNGTDDKDRIEQVMAVQFDDSGKYLAYSGNIKKSSGGDGSTEMIVAITTVKIWDRTATFRMPDVEATQNGLLWNKDLKFIAVSVTHKDSNNEIKPKVVIFDLV